MSTSRIVADSLWQCLCPSFSAQSLQSSRALLNRQRRPALQCLKTTTTSNGKSSSKRHVSVARLEALALQNKDKIAYYNPLSAKPTPEAQGEEARNRPPTFDTFTDVATPPNRTRLRNQRPKFEDTTDIRGGDDGSNARQMRELKKARLESESTPMLYEMARTKAAMGKMADVHMIVDVLVRQRREAPNLRLYGILILANVHPSEGAAWRVAALLQEMTNEGLEMDVGVCHDVLKVLSVHIDYLLRADILEYMHERWITLTEDGHHDVAAAFFREGQLEMGLEMLEKMTNNGMRIRPWLHDLATYVLSENGQFNDAFRLLNDQVEAGDSNVSKGVWLNLLDNASAAFHHEATVYCWKSQVNLGFINPSGGICLNVLTTAARAGDATLATDVFHVLSRRGTVFQPIHYEQLLATYIASEFPDLRAALTLLTIMATVKLEPTALSTRPLYAYLRDNPDQLSEAFDILTSLRDEDRIVPVAAFNVVIEAHVENRNVDEALIVYKAMHTFERPSNPEHHKALANVETFNLLLRGTYRAYPDYQTALFLASEMLALGIRPDDMTYDRLILVCLGANVRDHAYRYYLEMDSLGFQPRNSTIAILAKKFASVGDDRCWDILQRAQDRGNSLPRTKADVEKAWSIGMEKRDDHGHTVVRHEGVA